MKKIYLICLLVGLTINASAVTFAGKSVTAKDTVDLTASQYGIDEVESFFYTSGGQDYCSYAIFNYDNDFPELRVEVKAASRDHIQGLQDVVVETFSFLQLDENEGNRIYFTKVVFWLKFTNKNIDGDSQYNILIVADGNDGKVYKFRTNMPVYAYEKDEINHTVSVIKLLDEVDDSVVEPEFGGGNNPDDPNNPNDPNDPTTSLNNLESGASFARKVIENGQIYILYNGQKFNILGAALQ